MVDRIAVQGKAIFYVSAAVVVTYYPDEFLSDRLLTISNQVDVLIVVDNTPSGSEANQVRKLIETRMPSNLQLVQFGFNAGIATALNAGVHIAVEFGAAYVMTMDQDTNIPNGMVRQLVRSLEEGGGFGGVIAPIFNDLRTGRRSVVPVRKFGFLIPMRIRPSTGVYEVYTAITSGSLYRSTVFETVGMFREDYFIDAVDTEFCLRLLRSGYKVLMDSSVDIRHALGNRTDVVSLAGLKFAPTHYSPLRYYFITRNRIVLCAKYCFRFPGYVLYEILISLKITFRMFITERQRLDKLTMMWRGTYDALRCRLGPYSR